MNVRYASSKLTLIVLFLCIASACKKTDLNLSSDADFKSFSIVGAQTVSFNIMTVRERIVLQVPLSTTSGENLVANFTLGDGAQAKINNTVQISGTTKNNFSSDLDYMVTAANHSEKKWTVSVTNNSYSYNWGLGHFVNASAASDRNYEWYFDQGNSGIYSGINCGPTSATMAVKWSDSTFSKTPEDARNKYLEGGGWWLTSDVNTYLSDYSIPHAIIPLGTSAVLTQRILKEQLDSQRIVITCIDMNYVRGCPNDLFHTDKFYKTSPNWGHFFVVKGYHQVDGDFYFEIYDPYSLGLGNSDDGAPKGKNRFYHYEDVFNATNNWWKYAIVVGPKGKTLDINTLQKAVDPKKITHASAM